MSEITKAEMRKRLGNITQLQELLFGEQIKEYNRQLEQHNQKITRLEANYQRLQSVVEERVSQLESKVINRIDTVASSLEEKLQYFNLTAQQEQKKLQHELNSVSQHHKDNIDFLQNSLNANSNSLKTEVIEIKSALNRDMGLLKQQLTQKIESHLSELSNNKLSRADLADALFELCLKLRESAPNLTLTTSQDEEFAEESSVEGELVFRENENGSKSQF